LSKKKILSIQDMKHIHILGAGLVGSLLGIYLAKKSHEVSIYERRADFRKAGYSGGRSINLAMSDRGLQGLAGVGLDQKVRQLGIAMQGRTMHDTKGNLSYQPYGTADQCIYAVSRGKLNEFLLDEVEKYPNVRLHFDQRCTEVDLPNATFTLQHNQSKAEQEIKADLLFGADGAFSALRSAMQKTDRCNYSQQYLAHGYKELTIPAKDGKHQLDKNTLHIWPRGGFMLIALPNLDGSFTCTLFFPFEGSLSFASVNTATAIEHFFCTYFADVIPLLPNFVEEYLSNPTSSLVTVQTNPWVYGNKIALIGDAAHAIVPFYGQGMNAGFEDCHVLNQILDTAQGNWEKVLPTYQEARLQNTDAIAELALMNFVEMRDLVGKPEFLLRKKIEAKLHQLFPTVWIPLYTMVTFSADTPYSEALRLGKIQDNIMREVMQQPTIQQDWEQLNFEQIIQNYLKQR
jgi:kynurenine 3-monooxygenase